MIKPTQETLNKLDDLGLVARARRGDDHALLFAAWMARGGAEMTRSAFSAALAYASMSTTRKPSSGAPSLSPDGSALSADQKVLNWLRS